MSDCRYDAQGRLSCQTQKDPKKNVKEDFYAIQPFNCPNNTYLTQISGKSGGWMDQVTLKCSDNSTQSSFGGTGGNAWTTLTSANGFSSIDTTSTQNNAYIQNLVAKNNTGTVVGSGGNAIGGANPRTVSCPSGQVIYGLDVDVGASSGPYMYVMNILNPRCRLTGNLTDVTNSLIGKTIIFKDPRENKFFQTGRFNQTSILDSYKGAGRDGYVTVTAASNGARLTINNEYLSCNGNSVIKTMTADANSIWKVWLQLDVNSTAPLKYYFQNVNYDSGRRYMYAAGNGVVSMDLIDSTNVRSFGGFTVVLS